MADKQCNTCGVFRPLNAFALVPGSLLPGARYGWCKQCYREIRAGWRLEARRAARQEAQEQRQLAWERRQKEPDYQKRRANTIVSVAVRDGQLIRLPCERCGSTRKVEGHHADYSKPLEVEWLCRPCHRRHHAALHRKEQI